MRDEPGNQLERPGLLAVENVDALLCNEPVDMPRAGFEVPEEAIDRDFSQPREPSPGVVAVLKTIYDDPEAQWAEYEACEALLDIANNFHFWRFHHMKTVERIIGHKRGTGGSSGVAFLKRALEVDIFPELIQVRTEIGSG